MNHTTLALSKAAAACKWVVFLAVAALLSAATVTAAGYKGAEKTGAGIAEFRDEIVNVRQAASAAMAALDKIVETAATDPRKAYKEFEKALPRVDAAVEKAKKRAEAMQARGQAYFQQWEQELATLNNAEIRQLAAERKVKLQETFGSISSLMVPAREQFTAWLTNLKDVQKYLSNDLTVTGVDAARELITKTQTEGRQVAEALDNVIAELNAIAAALTPARQGGQPK